MSPRGWAYHVFNNCYRANYVTKLGFHSGVDPSQQGKKAQVQLITLMSLFHKCIHTEGALKHATQIITAIINVLKRTCVCCCEKRSGKLPHIVIHEKYSIIDIIQVNDYEYLYQHKNIIYFLSCCGLKLRDKYRLAWWKWDPFIYGPREEMCENRYVWLCDTFTWNYYVNSCLFPTGGSRYTHGDCHRAVVSLTSTTAKPPAQRFPCST